MPPSKKFVGRLPAHLAHLKRPAEPAERPERPERSRSGRGAAEGAAPPAAPDRLTSLIPEVLRAMFPPVGVAGGPREVAQEDVLAAFAPYHRPNSRFERLMISRLVGQGYLRPRGARDKHGLSAAYTLTPKGEAVLVTGRVTPTSVKVARPPRR